MREETLFLESVLKSVPIRCVNIGDVIEGSIRQEYVNTYDVPLEVVYTFPVPDKAAITGLTITVGDRCIETAILEKERANKQYAKAIVDGNSAFMLESERPNINRLTLGRVEPGERIVAETRFCMMRELTGGHARISIPTVIAPRYISCQPVRSAQSDGAKQDAGRIMPQYGETGYMAAFKMDIDPLGSIEMDPSPSHRMICDQKMDGRWHVSLEDGCCEADRDIVVLYHYVEDSMHSGGIMSDNGLMLAQFIPRIVETEKTQRAYSILLDCSGSMTGKLGEAKKAVEDVFDFMKEGDLFQIVCFNHEVFQLSGQMRYYDRYTKDVAIHSLSQIIAGGGTEILAPLCIALQQPGEFQNHNIILITDGQVGNEREIVAMVQQNLKRNTRLFTVGIGCAANSYLINELADVGKGAAEHVFPGEELYGKIKRQMARCAGARIRDAKLLWADGKTCRGMEPPKLPEIFNGDQISVVLRLNGTEQWPLILAGTADKGRWECRLNKKHVKKGDGVFINRILARSKIRRMEREYDASGNEYIKNELKKRAISQSIENGVISRWTTYYSEMLRRSEGSQLPRTYHVPAAGCDAQCMLPDDAVPSLFSGSGLIGYSKDLLLEEKEEERENRRILDEKWEVIAGASWCSQSPEAGRVSDILKALWKKGLANAPEDCADICDVLRGLIGNTQAAGYYNINIYNVMILAADEILQTKAIKDIESCILNVLMTIEEGRDEQLHKAVVELMLDVIIALAPRSDRQPIICRWTDKIAMDIGYKITTPDTKRLGYALGCLHIQFLCYNHKMSQKGAGNG